MTQYFLRHFERSFWFLASLSLLISVVSAADIPNKERIANDNARALALVAAKDVSRSKQ